ncbi:MAG: ATP-binding cassette domain-containing protein, partial [Pseudomonadota bacterium]
TALFEVDLTVLGGGILGFFGPKGAGKTTLLNVLWGFQRPTTGSVLLDGDDITGWPAFRIARRGVARTFQAVRLFPELTVLENIQIGAAGVGQSLAAAQRRAREVATHLDLEERLDLRAGALPYGEERRVGIARALAMEPNFLMLDEPAAGLNDVELEELLSVLQGLPAAFGCGLLVVEHNMRLIMALCENIHVLAEGRSLADGPPDDIRHNSDVRRAYLGVASDTRTASPAEAPSNVT